MFEETIPHNKLENLMRFLGAQQTTLVLDEPISNFAARQEPEAKLQQTAYLIPTVGDGNCMFRAVIGGLLMAAVVPGQRHNLPDVQKILSDIHSEYQKLSNLVNPKHQLSDTLLLGLRLHIAAQAQMDPNYDGFDNFCNRYFPAQENINNSNDQLILYFANALRELYATYMREKHPDKFSIADFRDKAFAEMDQSFIEFCADLGIDIRYFQNEADKGATAGYVYSNSETAKCVIRVLHDGGAHFQPVVLLSDIERTAGMQLSSGETAPPPPSPDASVVDTDDSWSDGSPDSSSRSSASSGYTYVGSDDDEEDPPPVPPMPDEVAPPPDVAPPPAPLMPDFPKAELNSCQDTARRVKEFDDSLITLLSLINREATPFNPEELQSRLQQVSAILGLADEIDAESLTQDTLIEHIQNLCALIGDFDLVAQIATVEEANVPINVRQGVVEQIRNLQQHIQMAGVFLSDTNIISSQKNRKLELSLFDRVKQLQLFDRINNVALEIESFVTEQSYVSDPNTPLVINKLQAEINDLFALLKKLNVFNQGAAIAKYTKNKEQKKIKALADLLQLIREFYTCDLQDYRKKRTQIDKIFKKYVKGGLFAPELFQALSTMCHIVNNYKQLVFDMQELQLAAAEHDRSRAQLHSIQSRRVSILPDAEVYLSLSKNLSQVLAATTKIQSVGSNLRDKKHRAKLQKVIATALQAGTVSRRRALSNLMQTDQKQQKDKALTLYELLERASTVLFTSHEEQAVKRLATELEDFILRLYENSELNSNVENKLRQIIDGCDTHPALFEDIHTSDGILNLQRHGKQFLDLAQCMVQDARGKLPDAYCDLLETDVALLQLIQSLQVQYIIPAIIPSIEFRAAASNLTYDMVCTQILQRHDISKKQTNTVVADIDTNWYVARGADNTLEFKTTVTDPETSAESEIVTVKISAPPASVPLEDDKPRLLFKAELVEPEKIDTGAIQLLQNIVEIVSANPLAQGEQYQVDISDFNTQEQAEDFLRALHYVFLSDHATAKAAEAIQQISFVFNASDIKQQSGAGKQYSTKTMLQDLICQRIGLETLTDMQFSAICASDVGITLRSSLNIPEPKSGGKGLLGRFRKRPGSPSQTNASKKPGGWRW
jgi:hypothetical protein